MKNAKIDTTHSGGAAASSQVTEREREFWDGHVPSLDECLSEFEAGPDANTACMLEAVEPLQGKRVLDFGCGAGVTSAWLAQRGAMVTGIDISPASVERAREVAEHAGVDVQLIVGELAAETFPAATFDAITGRYILHHIDLASIGPILDYVLAPRGSASFLETMGLNPLLSFARRRLAGRAGIASFGSEDEHPISRIDLSLLGRTVGDVDLDLGQMTFLRIFDRNVFRFRHRRVSRVLGAIDDGLHRMGLGSLSYHQVVTVKKRNVAL